ncbi:PEP-CTERM sorting domain-containing protein [Limisphaera sp. VF-2]|jgi:hypothetical protein|uniref:PEP-CTERM sorting domain-containing protein n=1 Tax=Limisphaera sp. VF-2 TaxID=3400418 RepID=UPI001762946E|nr:PEP-CTERM sorting domain-containing protein [Limisphaera sp.]
MKTSHAMWLAAAMGLALTGPARADVVISTFDNFTSDALYASWTTATIVSGPTAYTITASGYGSNWKYLGTIDGTGYDTVQLTVTLSGGGDGFLGPIVTLKDADGTAYHYAWYGQTLGSHVLTKPVQQPTWTEAGSIPGLDLATLTHLHLQLDPGGYAGTYTVAFEDLRLIPEPSALALLLWGGLSLGWLRRQR